MLGTLAAMYIMRNYDLTEDKAIEISNEIAKRKSQITTKSSVLNHDEELELAVKI